MAIDTAGPSSAAPAQERVSLIYNPRARSIAYQALLLLVIVFLVYEAGTNAAENLQRAHIASGFGFWNNTAGFAINQTLIPYTVTSTYGTAFWVGLLNTLLVSGLGVVFATVLGFTVGIARLSGNWIVQRLGTAYVEIIRNIPLLLQLVFWYTAVLQPLPNPRQSIGIFDAFFLNNRGMVVPRPMFGEGFGYVAAAFVLAVVLALLYRRHARRTQMRTGRQSPVLPVCAAVVIGLPLLVFLAAGRPLGFELPVLKGFNFVGGTPLYPEFLALLFGLSIYTAAFIAEIVRAGVLAITKGQTEAAYSLGLQPAPTLRLVVIPQAMRIIIPPLTSQYLNLTKNSSLAVAIGYPDLVQIFAGTVLNQTGQAVEVIAITMAVYLAISIVVASLMNWYNSRIALVER